MKDFPDAPTIIELTADLASDLTMMLTGLKMVRSALEDGANAKSTEEVMAVLVGAGFAMADTACRTAMVTLAVVGAVERIRHLDYGDAHALSEARKALPLLKDHLSPEHYAAVRERVNATPDGAPLNA